jgi:serpin B
MNRRRFLMSTLPLLAGAHLAWAAGSETPNDKPVDNKDLTTFASDTNQFGYDLFHKLRQHPGNLFYSPYSISSCLAMASSGAVGNTAQQMTKVMHLPPDQKQYSSLHAGLMKSLLDNPTGYKIQIANAMWGQASHPFKKDYVSLVQSQYRAEARSMDFATKAEACRQIINKWVEDQTNDLIKNLLPDGSVMPDTKLVLTNAVYFKGAWVEPFQKRWTKPEDFHTSASSAIKTDLMHRTDRMRYAENSDWQAVELPYKGNRLSMLVMLPVKKHGLGAIENSVTSATVDQLSKGLQPLKVILSLPKIKTSYEAMLKPTLVGMGMTDAFQFGAADFSGCDGTRELYISDVVHKAFCEVNEEGTEAAAATGTMMKAGAAAPRKEPDPKVFRADHPYLYLIRDNQTGAVLFLGRVTDPRS